MRRNVWVISSLLLLVVDQCKKRKGFMKKKGDVDFAVVSGIDVDEVEDLQPVVVADVSESDNIDVNMNDYNENSGNALSINEPVPSTSKDTSSSVPVDVPVSVPVSHPVNKYKNYRELVNRSKEKLKPSSFLFKAKTRLQTRKFGVTKKVGADFEGYKLWKTLLQEKACEKLIFRCRNCGIETKTFTSNKTGSQISRFDVNDRPMPPFHLLEKVLPNLWYHGLTTTDP